MNAYIRDQPSAATWLFFYTSLLCVCVCVMYKSNNLEYIVNCSKNIPLTCGILRTHAREIGDTKILQFRKLQ